jgi:putative hydrolase of the HAD superfamily
MGGVVAGNVHCVPAMAASLGLTADEFFAAAGVAPSATHGTAAANPYDLGDLRVIQEGALGSDEFWQRFEARAARLFPDRRIVLPRRPDGLPVDLWATFFQPVRDEAVVSIIGELIAAGYRVVGGTNTLDAHYEKHRSLGDYDCFQALYASQLLGVAKPDAEFWRRILAAEGFRPEQAFFADDNQANVDAAAALGISAHHFRSASRLREALAELGALSA